MTGRWLSVGEAASRLHRTEREVLALVIAGTLYAELRMDHYELAVDSVQEYARRLEKALASEQATSGDVLAEHAGPLVPRDPANPAEAQMTATDEHDYKRERET
ncbi:hypothetical protein ACFWYW_28465 [Nonomuraea sp. NPDC059023]|uniref:hypothetical protein n=1 Tax=unclassified Nonomuraea TaxID=2593643 RepID=UPI0036CA4DDD